MRYDNGPYFSNPILKIDLIPADLAIQQIYPFWKIMD